jgi:hypothetical protein
MTQVDQGLTKSMGLTQPVLMTLNKNLGRHNLPPQNESHPDIRHQD